MLDAFGRILKSEGFVVSVASDSGEALRAIVQHEFDVVITDLVMAGGDGQLSRMDGREVALAAKRSSAKTKVIVFTAFIEMSEMADLMNRRKVDWVLQKPMRPLEIVQVIRSLIGTPRD